MRASSATVRTPRSLSVRRSCGRRRETSLAVLAAEPRGLRVLGQESSICDFVHEPTAGEFCEAAPSTRAVQSIVPAAPATPCQLQTNQGQKLLSLRSSSSAFGARNALRCGAIGQIRAAGPLPRAVRPRFGLLLTGILRDWCGVPIALVRANEM